MRSYLIACLAIIVLPIVASPIVAEASEKDYRSAVKTMKRWEEDHPSLVKARTIGRSREDRPLKVLKICASSKPGLPGLYLGASIHGSERSHEDLIEVIGDLLRRRDEPEVARLLSSRVLWVQPLMNPDGVFHSNRKNAAGVDLNRNFDYLWGEWKGGKPAESHSRYPGPSAFSEPESRALRDFLTLERSIVLYFDMHRSARMILAPFGGSEDPLSEQMQGLAKGLDTAMGGRWNFRGGYQIYRIVPGGSGYTIDWVYGRLGVKALTLEYPYRSGKEDKASLRGALSFLMKAVDGLERRAPRRWF